MSDDFDSDRAPILECLKHRKWEHRKRGMERAKEEYAAGNNLTKYVSIHENIVKERTRQVIQAGMEMLAAWAKQAPPRAIAEAYPLLVAASMKGEGMKFARDATMDFFLSCFESGMNPESYVAPLLEKNVMKDRKKSGPMADVVAETLRAFGPKKMKPKIVSPVAEQFLNTAQPAVKEAGARVYAEFARFNYDGTIAKLIPDSLSKALKKKVMAALDAIPAEERGAAEATRAVRGETIEIRNTAPPPEEKKEEKAPEEKPTKKPERATEEKAPVGGGGGDSGVDTEWTEEEYTSYEEVVVDDRKQQEDPGPPKDCFKEMPQDEYKAHIGAFPRKWSDRKEVYESIRKACENVGKINSSSKATQKVLGVLKTFMDQESHQFNQRDLMNTLAMVASKLDNPSVLTNVFNVESVERICTVFSKNSHAHPGIVATLKEFYKGGHNFGRVGAVIEAGTKAKQPKSRLVMFQALHGIVVDNFGNEAARRDFGGFFISQGKWDLLIGLAGSDRNADVKTTASRFLSAFILMIGDNKKFSAQWEGNSNKQLKKRVAEMTPELKEQYDAASGEPRVERRPIKKKRKKKRPGTGGKKKKAAAAATDAPADGKKRRKVKRRRKKVKAPKEKKEKPASQYEVNPDVGNTNVPIPVLPGQIELKGRSKFQENQPIPERAIRDDFKDKWSEFSQIPKGKANDLLGRPVENADVLNNGRQHRKANEVLAEITNVVDKINEMPRLSPEQLVAAVSMFDHLMGFDEKARNPVGVKKMFQALTMAFRKTQIDGDLPLPVGKAAAHVFKGAAFKLFDSKFTALGTECADTVAYFAGPEKLVPRIFDEAWEIRKKKEKIWAAAIKYSQSLMQSYGVDRVNLYYCMNIAHQILGSGKKEGKDAVYNLIAECHNQLGPDWSNMYFGPLGSNAQAKRAVATRTKDATVGMQRTRLARGVAPPQPATPPASEPEASSYEEYTSYETITEGEGDKPPKEVVAEPEPEAATEEKAPVKEATPQPKEPTPPREPTPPPPGPFQGKIPDKPKRLKNGVGPKFKPEWKLQTKNTKFFAKIYGTLADDIKDSLLGDDPKQWQQTWIPKIRWWMDANYPDFLEHVDIVIWWLAENMANHGSKTKHAKELCGVYQMVLTKLAETQAVLKRPEAVGIFTPLVVFGLSGNKAAANMILEFFTLFQDLWITNDISEWLLDACEKLKDSRVKLQIWDLLLRMQEEYGLKMITKYSKALPVIFRIFEKADGKTAKKIVAFLEPVYAFVGEKIFKKVKPQLKQKLQREWKGVDVTEEQLQGDRSVVTKETLQERIAAARGGGGVPGAPGGAAVGGLGAIGAEDAGVVNQVQVQLSFAQAFMMKYGPNIPFDPEQIGDVAIVSRNQVPNVFDIDWNQWESGPKGQQPGNQFKLGNLEFVMDQSSSGVSAKANVINRIQGQEIRAVGVPVDIAALPDQPLEMKQDATEIAPPVMPDVTRRPPREVRGDEPDAPHSQEFQDIQELDGIINQIYARNPTGLQALQSDWFTSRRFALWSRASILLQALCGWFDEIVSRRSYVTVEERRRYCRIILDLLGKICEDKVAMKRLSSDSLKGFMVSMMSALIRNDTRTLFSRDLKVVCNTINNVLLNFLRLCNRTQVLDALVQLLANCDATSNVDGENIENSKEFQKIAAKCVHKCANSLPKERRSVDPSRILRSIQGYFDSHPKDSLRSAELEPGYLAVKMLIVHLVRTFEKELNKHTAKLRQRLPNSEVLQLCEHYMARLETVRQQRSGSSNRQLESAGENIGGAMTLERARSKCQEIFDQIRSRGTRANGIEQFRKFLRENPTIEVGTLVKKLDPRLQNYILRVMVDSKQRIRSEPQRPENPAATVPRSEVRQPRRYDKFINRNQFNFAAPESSHDENVRPGGGTFSSRARNLHHQMDQT